MKDLNESLEAAKAKRRQILGDAYVDSVRSETDPAALEFQDYLTQVAWSVWTRDGFSARERSLLVMAMTAALGRMEEFSLHARSQLQTGVTDADLDELVFQIAAYCGAPAGVSARRHLRAIRDAREERP